MIIEKIELNLNSLVNRTLLKAPEVVAGSISECNPLKEKKKVVLEDMKKRIEEEAEKERTKRNKKRSLNKEITLKDFVLMTNLETGKMKEK